MLGLTFLAIFLSKFGFFQSPSKYWLNYIIPYFIFSIYYFIFSLIEYGMRKREIHKRCPTFIPIVFLLISFFIIFEIILPLHQALSRK